MAFISLQLADVSHKGSADQVQHEYLLKTTDETDLSVMTWLQTASPTFSGVIERPDFTNSYSQATFPGSEFPILPAYGGLPIENIEYTLLNDRNPQNWQVVATYKPGSGGGGGGIGSGGVGAASASIAFEFGNEQKTIRQSIATIIYDPVGGTAPDFFGAVNVQADGTTDGVTIPNSAQVISFAYTNTAAFFSTAKIKAISRACSLGVVNSTITNLGGIDYAPGEVRLVGVSGEVSSSGDSTLDIRFGIIENETISLPGISGSINKKGWHYLWTYYGKAVSNNQAALKPKGAYVEQLLPERDLNAIFA